MSLFAGCRISCHKRCHSKLQQRCSVIGGDAGSATHVFGTALQTLIDDETSVPAVLENLLLCVEVRGLYLEGIYRKSASAVQVKQIRTRLETAQGKSIPLQATFSLSFVVLEALSSLTY